MFTLAKEWKQMNFPPTGEGISGMRNLVKIISTTERNKGPTHAAVGTGLEKAMLGGKRPIGGLHIVRFRFCRMSETGKPVEIESWPEAPGRRWEGSNHQFAGFSLWGGRGTVNEMLYNRMCDAP